MDLENLTEMTEAEAEALLHSDSEAPEVEQGSKDPEICPRPVVLSNMGQPTSKRPRHRTRLGNDSGHLLK